MEKLNKLLDLLSSTDKQLNHEKIEHSIRNRRMIGYINLCYFCICLISFYHFFVYAGEYDINGEIDISYSQIFRYSVFSFIISSMLTVFNISIFRTDSKMALLARIIISLVQSILISTILIVTFYEDRIVFQIKEDLRTKVESFEQKEVRHDEYAKKELELLGKDIEQLYKQIELENENASYFSKLVKKEIEGIGPSKKATCGSECRKYEMKRNNAYDLINSYQSEIKERQEKFNKMSKEVQNDFKNKVTEQKQELKDNQVYDFITKLENLIGLLGTNDAIYYSFIIIAAFLLLIDSIVILVKILEKDNDSYTLLENYRDELNKKILEASFNKDLKEIQNGGKRNDFLKNVYEDIQGGHR
ncbi:MAG: DUF4407 domain-containing protein [Aliarcobacter sp.]|nr:DUF4407 domain-containing protein [Aliarcobacter sp.]